jgi:hypothetical protein
MRLSSILSSLALAGAFALSLAGAATAQISPCFQFDNLNGACCAPTVSNLPSFPGYQSPGKAICWTNCNVSGQVKTRTILTPPVQTDCSGFQANIEVNDFFSGTVYLFGQVTLDYTRTWEEQPPIAGASPIQVWRFAAKADLKTSSPTLPGSCPVPMALGMYPTAFYYGYVDYAFDCTTGQWDTAVVLFHAGDLFINKPGISSTPAPAGGLDPNRCYAVVAPDTAANPFVPSNNLFPGGPLIGEGMRLKNNPGTVLCNTEEFLSSGFLNPFFQLCLCTIGLVPPQMSVNIFNGQGTCPDASGVPSNFQSLNLWSAFPWFHLVTTSIGHWTTMNSYPGNEVAWVDEGAFLYHDSCGFGPGLNGDSYDIMYGGSTSKGYTVSPNPIFPTSQNFKDLASNFSHGVGIPFPSPLILVGHVMPTRHLIYVNTP